MNLVEVSSPPEKEEFDDPVFNEFADQFPTSGNVSPEICLFFSFFFNFLYIKTQFKKFKCFHFSTASKIYS
jgi:hypothetical protein